VANDAAEPLPLVNHMTVPEALLGHQVHVDKEEEDNVVNQQDQRTTVTKNPAEPTHLLTVSTACLVDKEEVIVATQVQAVITLENIQIRRYA
jgi:hypothetical protein